MASPCLRKGLEWLLGKTSSSKECQPLEEAAQGSDLITIPGGI